jgi:hypothetical protein
VRTEMEEKLNEKDLLKTNWSGCVQSNQKGLLMDNTVSLGNEGMKSIKLFWTIKIGPIIPDDDTLKKWTWGTGSADQYHLKDQAMIWEPDGDNPCGNFIRKKDTLNKVRIKSYHDRQDWGPAPVLGAQDQRRRICNQRKFGGKNKRLRHYPCPMERTRPNHIPSLP